MSKATGVAVKFKRTPEFPWEKGTAFYDGARLLMITTEANETILCDPLEVKKA